MEQAPDVWDNLRSLYLSWLICGQQGANVGQFKQYNATNHTVSWELDESDSGINKKSDQKKNLIHEQIIQNSFMVWIKLLIENIWQQTKMNSWTKDSGWFLNWMKLFFEKIWIQKRLNSWRN